MHVGHDVAATDAQAAPMPSGRWTHRERTAFFDHFAESGDVAAAAAAVGKTAASAFVLRRRSVAFAAAWRAAMDVRFDQLEMAVIRKVQSDVDGELDVKTAMLLLDRHRAADEGVAASKARAADAAAVRKRSERELLRRLQALSKRPGAGLAA